MFSFLAFVILEIVFEILDYVWNSIAFLDKENSRYRLCPRNFDFWHSAHGVISSLSLLVIVVIFAKIRMNNLNLQSWLGFATFIQLISAYWLYVGITWIEKIKKTSPECLPESELEVNLTYLSGCGLWILESFLVYKCATYSGNLPGDSRFAVAALDALEEIQQPEGEMCAICLDGMSLGVKLNCGHSFHRECLSLWVNTSQTCPYCRERIG